jgi:hypothetical protein
MKVKIRVTAEAYESIGRLLLAKNETVETPVLVFLEDVFTAANKKAVKIFEESNQLIARHDSFTVTEDVNGK